MFFLVSAGERRPLKRFTPPRKLNGGHDDDDDGSEYSDSDSYTDSEDYSDSDSYT